VNHQFLGRDLHPQDIVTFHGAPGRLQILHQPRHLMLNILALEQMIKDIQA